MKIVKNKIMRQRRNSFVPSASYGIRAENSFWENCNKVAKIEKISRNQLIVRVVAKYCTRKLNRLSKNSLEKR